MDDDFPVILGFDSVNDLSDRENATPRLSGLRSVSEAAVRALHNERRPAQRAAGFIHGRIMGCKR